MSHRDSILEGAKEAKRLHEIIGSEHRIDRTGGRIDVFGTALQQDALLMFRDLKGILGAYLNEDGARGIIVTTQRRLAVQRFTGAHELGHLVMGHAPSVDKEDILGGPACQLPAQEIEANAFAAEFLSPRWLLAHHARQQGWDATSMSNPVCVYQMALRIGMSYDATCRSLHIHKLISQGTMQSLLAVQPKQIKRSILPAAYEPENWHCDVWLLGERDQGAHLEGHPDDLFVIRLREKNGAGYLWSRAALDAEGFKILHENREALPGDKHVGSDSLYEVTAGPAPVSYGKFRLNHSRPWQPAAPLNTVEVSYDVYGKESAGISRAERRQHQAA